MRHKIRFATLLTVASLMLPLSAVAGTVDQLRDFLQTTRSLKADFAQLVVSKSGRKPQSSTGQVMISRPGKLRWEIQKPYPQTLIGDGEKIWIYDPELQQVTVRKAAKALGGTPAALLAGNNDLERNFDLREGGQADGLSWVDALPKTNDSGFEKMRLGFAAGELRGMELHDTFGQVTHIRFSRLERNPTLPANTFRFVPPAGVDVIGE